MLGLVSFSARGEIPASFIDAEQIRSIAESRGWRRLLHYRSPFLRSERSDVDSISFFLSSAGKSDSESELRATLEAFLQADPNYRSSGPIEQPAACSFPARRAFLEAKLGKRFPDLECTAFSDWKKGIDAQAATLVYSAAYPGNPASMFGHTFLRLDRDTDPARGLSQGSHLRSYSVDFSASIGPDENPAKYALWGLIGGYEGRFDLGPYYRKVNQYAFFESRDLWEYRLSLTPPEVDQLVRHVWELFALAGYDYYFLDENCSLRILALLEAVRGDWDLLRGFPVSVIPIETIKRVIDTPGAVAHIHHRASLKHEMNRTIDALSEKDKRSVERAYKNKALAKDEVPFSANALDALSAAQSYKKARTNFEPSSADAHFLKSILLARSKAGASSPGSSGPPPPAPHLSHGTSLVFFSGGVREGEPQFEAGMYAFRHDFLDPMPSFNPDSEIRVLGLRAEKRAGAGLRLAQVDLLAMASLAPWSSLDPQTSWRVGVEWRRVPEVLDPGRGEWKGSGGYGMGLKVWRSSLIYLLGTGEVEKSGVFRHHFRISLGPEFGAVIRIVPDRLSIIARLAPLWDAFRAVSGREWMASAEFQMGYAWSRNIDTRISARRETFGRTEGESTFLLRSGFRF